MYVDTRGHLQVSVLAICFDTATLLAQDCTHLADKTMSPQGGKFLSLLPISTREPWDHRHMLLCPALSGV